MIIKRTRHVAIEFTDAGCVSTFPTGASYGAHPHDTTHYNEIAARCGYLDRAMDGTPDLLGRARLDYCREHDVLHHIVGEEIYGGRSLVLWPLANGAEPEPIAALHEEALVALLQRWVRAGERPIIGGVDWDALRARALEVLDG